MGQIERKKKGRPSRADLVTRPRGSVGSTASGDDSGDLRRSSRRKSFRYNIIDYDEDYLDGDDDDDFFRAADVAVRGGGGGQSQRGGVEVSDEEEEDDEDERDGDRKKLKLVVKIESNSSGGGSRGRRKGRNRGGGRVDSVSRARRVEPVSRSGRVTESDDDGDDDDDDDEVVRRKVKKRRISARRDDYDDENGDVDDDEDDDVDDEGVDGNNGDSKKEAKREDSVPGTPTVTDRSETPLPDKKLLELILDKLQRKDTYGVYSEPVDPEELPDYFDVIEHPMDFSTVRKKLASGSYSILEQFEADVFLISSNAMQYNAPDTVYHKQARAIKELAERKFQRVRLQIERLEKEKETEIKCEPKFEPKSELKSEPRDRPNSIVKKQGKKPFGRSVLEPVVSDFSSGATLATTDSNNVGGMDTVGNLARLGNNDGLTEGISFLVDNNAEKAEDPHSGKGALPKFGKRSFLVDENRRSTYNASSQPGDRLESLFTPLDDEKKQLISVGSLGEHSYARSLARFAASLGPIGWGVASKRIEQVLPQGVKFGRGWVGESEPLPTVVIFKGKKDYPLVSRSNEGTKLERNYNQLHYPVLNRSSSDGKMVSIFGSGGGKPPTPSSSVPQQQRPTSLGSVESDNKMLKGAEFNHQPTNDQKNVPIFQQQHWRPTASVCPENMGSKRVGPTSPPSYTPKTEDITQRQPPYGASVCPDNNTGAKRVGPTSPSSYTQKTEDTTTLRQPYGVEMAVNRPRPNSPSKCNQKMDTGVENQNTTLTKGKNFLQSLPFKQPDANGGTHTEGLQNGRAINSQNIADSDRVVSSRGLIPPHLAGTTVNDPVLVMKMLTEKAQKQQTGSMPIHVQTPPQPRPSVPSPRGNSGTHGAGAAPNAWMPVGVVGFRPGSQNPNSNAGNLNPVDTYGAAQMFYPHPQGAQPPRGEYPTSGMVQFQTDKKGFPFHAFGSQPVRVGTEPQVPSRPMVFHQTVANDLSRFQSPAWRGLSAQAQQKQKQETLPPDLNVAFQSVDSQQPDLALQL